MTATHPSTQPRLVKEADALVEAGYRVRVVATKLVAWAAAADREFEQPGRLGPDRNVRALAAAAGDPRPPAR